VAEEEKIKFFTPCFCIDCRRTIQTKDKASMVGEDTYVQQIQSAAEVIAMVEKWLAHGLSHGLES
jgi:hypothetical protein